MIAYAIKNKNDGRFVYGFDFRSDPFNPKMRYIGKDIEQFKTPKLFSKFKVEKYPELIPIPKCCEFVKVEIKEVKENE